MTFLISHNSGRLWTLIGALSLLMFFCVWIPSCCYYNPEDLGALQSICSKRRGTEASHPQAKSRLKRSAVATPKSDSEKVAITQEGDTVIFWFNSSNTHVATFIFSMKQMGGPAYTSQYLQYGRGRGSNRLGTGYICITGSGWGEECSSWGAAGWNTGDDWGYKPQPALDRKDKNGKSLISRMTLTKRNADSFVLNIENPSPSDASTYIFGLWWGGGYRTFQVKFKIKDMYNSQEWKPSHSASPLKVPHISTFKEMVAIGNPTYEDTLASETGFSDVNLWLEWMKYNANTHNKSNCYVCGKARPHLGTVPLNIPEDQEECFLSLYTAKPTNNTQCERWKRDYPIMSKNQNPGAHITIYPGNYTCYVSQQEGRDLKTFPEGYCSNRRNNTENIVNQTRSLGDIYWICGDMKIRTKLEKVWKGECALAKIIMPIHIATENEDKQATQNNLSNRRRKRESPGGSFDPHIYIDSIGVPRGVPDEFKARDQVAAGFESLLPAITVNKNVDWINYIYYNQQRFVNDTRDALKGLAEQLEATSQMTFQNRMALDMILAEKGGTCIYIGKVDGCCTWIPDNTGPDGKVTLAIKKLEDLSIELKKNSGLDNPWDQYFGWITSWKQGLVQFGIIICVILLVIGIVVMCIIPCFKKMLSKGLDNVTMLAHNAPEYQVPLTHSPDEYTDYVRRYKQKKKNYIV